MDGSYFGLLGVLSIDVLPASLGPNVYRYDLLWAVWSH